MSIIKINSHEKQYDLYDDHHWKGEDHLQQFQEHLPSSTSCSHTQPPKQAMHCHEEDEDGGAGKSIGKNADFDRNDNASTSCSHTQAPKQAMKKKKMMLVVGKILVKNADYDRNDDRYEDDDDDADIRKKDYDKDTNQSISH